MEYRVAHSFLPRSALQNGKTKKSVLEHRPRAGLFMAAAERSENAGVHYAERLSDGPTPEATCVQY